MPLPWPPPLDRILFLLLAATVRDDDCIYTCGFASRSRGWNVVDDNDDENNDENHDEDDDDDDDDNGGNVLLTVSNKETVVSRDQHGISPVKVLILSESYLLM